MIVNIYIYQTIRGPGKKEGAYSYVLESVIHGEPHTKDETGILEPMSENKAELVTLLKALKRITKSCEVLVFTRSNHIINGYENWLDKWILTNWKTAKGQEVANKAEWQQILEYKKRLKIAFLLGENHSYSNWMKTEAGKKVKND